MLDILAAADWTCTPANLRVWEPMGGIGFLARGVTDMNLIQRVRVEAAVAMERRRTVTGEAWARIMNAMYPGTMCRVCDGVGVVLASDGGQVPIGPGWHFAKTCPRCRGYGGDHPGFHPTAMP